GPAGESAVQGAQGEGQSRRSTIAVLATMRSVALFISRGLATAATAHVAPLRAPATPRAGVEQAQRVLSGPALADTLFLAALAVSPVAASLSLWPPAGSTPQRPRRRMPPELKGGVMGMGVGFTVGAAYGLYHDLKGCYPLLCGFGPVAYGIYGAGLGIMVGVV